MIDAHLHLLEPERFDYPWLSRAPALRAAECHAAAALAQPRGGVRAIGVEGDVAEPLREAEALRLLSLCEEPATGVLAVVASVRPERDDFSAQLARIHHPQLVGVRRVLHVVPDEVSRASTFRRNVARLAAHGITFDLCVRHDQLDLALALVQAAPETHFVLDHGGNPPLSHPAALAAWEAGVARLAQQPLVMCKLSGLVNHLAPGIEALPALRPIVAHLAQVFGWQRLVFGSDWPVSTLAGYDRERWLSLARQLLPEGEDRARVLEHNVARAYPLLDAARNG